MIDIIEYYLDLEERPHVGEIIREHILPKESTKNIAKMLCMGRSALSRLLNGKSDLSIRTAARIESVFKYSGKALLMYQLYRNYDNYMNDITIEIPGLVKYPGHIGNNYDNKSRG